jgi:uncharacterized coiled-coil DUF342 family protein
MSEPWSGSGQDPLTELLRRVDHLATADMALSTKVDVLSNHITAVSLVLTEVTKELDRLRRELRRSRPSSDNGGDD